MTSIKILLHLYGIISGRYFDEEFEMPPEFTLFDVERRIIQLYKKDISKQYLTADELLDQNYIVVVDKNGRPISKDGVLKDISEIWFLIPIAGG